MLKNCTEDAVDVYFSIIMDRFDRVCNCERCIEDIKAITLNHLPPAYVVTEKGELYNKINQLAIQYKVDIMNELIKAIEIVSKNPNHNNKLS
jgi:competence protein ComFB